MNPNLNMWLPLIICLLGLVAFALTDGKIAVLGLNCFWVGLLVFLLGRKSLP